MKKNQNEGKVQQLNKSRSPEFKQSPSMLIKKNLKIASNDSSIQKLSQGSFSTVSS